jgi:hypothetical protein
MDYYNVIYIGLLGRLIYVLTEGSVTRLRDVGFSHGFELRGVWLGYIIRYILFWGSKYSPYHVLFNHPLTSVRP